MNNKILGVDVSEITAVLLPDLNWRGITPGTVGVLDEASRHFTFEALAWEGLCVVDVQNILAIVKKKP